MSKYKTKSINKDIQLSQEQLLESDIIKHNNNS